MRRVSILMNQEKLVFECAPVGLQLAANIGWPSDGCRLRKLFIVDFMPLKSKMRRVLSRLPDSRRDPL